MWDGENVEPDGETSAHVNDQSTTKLPRSFYQLWVVQACFLNPVVGVESERSHNGHGRVGGAVLSSDGLWE